MFLNILIILITGTVIYFSGKQFASVSSEIGEYFNLPRSVKGATLDAIASSFPELIIAIFSIIFFGEFSVGVGTVAGSVLFNTLVIPSLAVLVSPVVFRIRRDVIARDVMFYSVAIFVFLSAILYSERWGVALSVIFIAIYIWYVKILVIQTKDYQSKHQKLLGEEISVVFKIMSACFHMIIMSIAAYFLTKTAINISEILVIPPVVIGFSLIAITTSFPDAVIAMVNARKGYTNNVISLVFGSNIFNILIALGIPLFLASSLAGRSVDVITGGVSVVIGLLISTIIVIYFIIDDYILSKKNAFFMLFSYIVFIIYLFITTIL